MSATSAAASIKSGTVANSNHVVCRTRTLVSSGGNKPRRNKIKMLVLKIKYRKYDAAIAELGYSAPIRTCFANSSTKGKPQRFFSRASFRVALGRHCT